MGGWNFIDRTGMRWGKLVAIEYLGNKKWLCNCDCGNKTIVDSDHLRINRKQRSTMSCGCGKKSRLIKNIDYFKELDTEAKAYILGFLASDGTITYDTENGVYSVKIVVNSIDRHILEIIKKEFNTGVEVKDYIETANLPQGGTCASKLSSLLLCSKELVEDVMKYGVVPRKSLVLDINYNLIPKELKRHFWRGLYDGDGSFGVYGEKEILELSLITSKTMAESTKEEILKIFPDFKINYYPAMGCSENTVRLFLTTQYQAFTFLNYMYKNNTICLERKYQKYLDIKKCFKYFNDYPI